PASGLVLAFVEPAVNLISNKLVHPIKISCSSGATLSFSFSGASIQGLSGGQNVQCPSNGIYSGTLNLVAGNAEKSVSVSSSLSGASLPSISRKITSDQTAPNLKITTPNGHATESSGMTLSGNCSAGDSKVEVSGNIATLAPFDCPQNGNFNVNITLSGS